MVKHVFANGKTTTDITGHLVRREDCPTIYSVLERSNNESTGTVNNTHAVSSDQAE